MNLDLKLKNREMKKVMQKQTAGGKHKGVYGEGARGTESRE